MLIVAGVIITSGSYIQAKMVKTSVFVATLYEL